MKFIRMLPLATLIALTLALSLIPLQTQASSPFGEFSVRAAVGPASTQIPPYGPNMPAGWTKAGNGLWSVINNAPGSFAFAFGTANYRGETYIDGAPVIAFPNPLGALNNGLVHCSGPYDTTYSQATATLSLTKPTSVHVYAVTDDGIAVFYKPVHASSWSSVFGSSPWNLHGATSYSTTVTLKAGPNQIRVAWFNGCSGGEESVQFSGLPLGATVQPDTSA